DEDAASLVRHANNSAVWRNMRDAFPHPYTDENARSWLSYVRSLEEPTHFAISYQGEAVGGVGLIRGSDVERVSAEIGYWLGEALWGRGLATAAVTELLDIAFDALPVHRVFAVPFQRNAPSIRVLEKLGFRQEGVLLESAWKDDRFESQLIYGMTAP